MWALHNTRLEYHGCIVFRCPIRVCSFLAAPGLLEVSRSYQWTVFRGSNTILSHANISFADTDASCTMMRPTCRGRCKGAAAIRARKTWLWIFDKHSEWPSKIVRLRARKTGAVIYGFLKASRSKLAFLCKTAGGIAFAGQKVNETAIWPRKFVGKWIVRKLINQSMLNHSRVSRLGNKASVCWRKWRASEGC